MDRLDTGGQDELMQFRHVGESPCGNGGEAAAPAQVDARGIAVGREIEIHAGHRRHNGHGFHIFELCIGAFQQLLLGFAQATRQEEVKVGLTRQSVIAVDTWIARILGVEGGCIVPPVLSCIDFLLLL